MCMKKFDAEKIRFDRQYVGGIRQVILTAKFHLYSFGVRSF